MTTLYLPRERNEWFLDKDGVPTTSKHKDEIKTYDVDFAEQLTSGETLATVTTDPQGVTVSASSIVAGIDAANTAARLTVTDTDGHVEITVTTSTSRTLVQLIRFIGNPLPSPERDYRR